MKSLRHGGWLNIKEVRKIWADFKVSGAIISDRRYKKTVAIITNCWWDRIRKQVQLWARVKYISRDIELEHKRKVRAVGKRSYKAASPKCKSHYINRFYCLHYLNMVLILILTNPFNRAIKWRIKQLYKAQKNRYPAFAESIQNSYPCL